MGNQNKTIVQLIFMFYQCGPVYNPKKTPTVHSLGPLYTYERTQLSWSQPLNVRLRLASLPQPHCH